MGEQNKLNRAKPSLMQKREVSSTFPVLPAMAKTSTKFLREPSPRR